jgi:hypothetical protein
MSWTLRHYFFEHEKDFTERGIFYPCLEQLISHMIEKNFYQELRHYLIIKYKESSDSFIEDIADKICKRLSEAEELIGGEHGIMNISHVFVLNTIKEKIDAFIKELGID